MKSWEVILSLMIAAAFFIAGILYYYMKIYVPPEARLAIAFNSLALGMTEKDVDTLFPEEELPRVILPRGHDRMIYVISYELPTPEEMDILAADPTIVSSTFLLPSLKNRLLISVDPQGFVDAYNRDSIKESRSEQKR